MRYEHDRAIMEMKRNASSIAYFNARHPVRDTNGKEKLFDDDFQRGWETANSAKSLQSAEFKTIYGALKIKLWYCNLLWKLKILAEREGFEPSIR